MEPDPIDVSTCEENRLKLEGRLLNGTRTRGKAGGAPQHADLSADLIRQEMNPQPSQTAEKSASVRPTSALRGSKEASLAVGDPEFLFFK